jgi:hypothetical protein
LLGRVNAGLDPELDIFANLCRHHARPCAEFAAKLPSEQTGAVGDMVSVAGAGSWNGTAPLLLTDIEDFFVRTETGTCLPPYHGGFPDPRQPAVQMNAKSKSRIDPGPSMGFRPAPPLRAAIVRWAAHQAEKPTLSEAISRLVELGLAATDNREGPRDGQKRRARKLAGETIDHAFDATTNTDDRATRKRHLLNGPEEFSRVRIDRPKS